MICYHATDKKGFNGIKKDGCIKANRLPNVYLFMRLNDAIVYASTMGLKHVLSCAIEKNQIESRWKPKYAEGGVIKLKKNQCVDIIIME